MGPKRSEKVTAARATSEANSWALADMLRGAKTLKSVEKPAALNGVFPGHGSGSGSFAGACDRESFRNVQAKRGGVPIGRVVHEREPARGQEQIRGVLVDGGGAHAGNGAIFFIEEQAGVSGGERDVAIGGAG